MLRQTTIKHTRRQDNAALVVDRASNSDQPVRGAAMKVNQAVSEL